MPRRPTETDDDDLPAEAQHERLAFELVRQTPYLPSAGDLGVVGVPVTPWPHQLEVVRRATARYPQGFLFCDEVGLGKTIEAALALRSLLISGRVRRVLLLVPRAVLRQWHEELHEKTALEVARLEGDGFVDVRGRPLSPRRRHDNPWNRHDLILASSQTARRAERRAELLAADRWDLVLVDEAHHARRRNPESEGYQPNRLLELLAGPARRDRRAPDDAGLVRRTRCLWLLTATPMQIHPVELWDLLALVGAPVPADDRGAGGTEHAWRGHLFRHTREVLRDYRRRGLLDAEVPVRRPENVWIELGEDARRVYRRIETHLGRFYRRYEAERPGLGFVMTVYRRRLTSSFEAIRRSLERRRAKLLDPSDDARTRTGAEPLGIEEIVEIAGRQDDLFAPTRDADGATSGNWSDELASLDDFLDDLRALGDDPKVETLRRDLRALLAERDRVLVFTQFLDTLDHLRDVLAAEHRVACWSGRGAEILVDGAWVVGEKEDLKASFGRGEIDVLLATEAAGEGLNLQSCGVLINFDLPWNPMRVEQRIGRIDRIGQRHPEVWVRSYFYAGTVEAEVYRRLSDRIRWFEDVVGTLQPILQRVGETIGEVAMASWSGRGRRLEERLGALRSDLEARDASLDLSFDAVAGQQALEAQPPSAPIVPADLEQLFVGSLALGDRFERLDPEGSDPDGRYALRFGGKVRPVTFRPAVYDAHPYSTTLLTWGVDLFHRLLDQVPEPRAIDDPGGIGLYRAERPAPVALFLLPDLRQVDAPAALHRVADPGRWQPRREADAASRFSAVRREALRFRREIEASRRVAERDAVQRAARTVVVRCALLEGIDAATPELFDAPSGWSFGRAAVSSLRRHGGALADLVERLDVSAVLPTASADDPFLEEARGHRRGWRTKRRRRLEAEAEELAARWGALERAEADAAAEMDAAGAGHLVRRFFPLGAAHDDDGSADPLRDAHEVDPFVDAVPAFDDVADAAHRLADAVAEGIDPLADLADTPHQARWLPHQAPAARLRRRFAVRIQDDALAARLPEGSWAVFELPQRPATRGDIVLCRLGGNEIVVRRLEPEASAGGQRLVLAADAPGASIVLDDPEPDAVEIVGILVG